MSSRRNVANAIRALAMDAVQKANSGHPGMPMGMADIAEVLWNDFLKHNPNHPNWANRDRFIISNGHGSMLLYALLHLSGYQSIRIEDIKQFRQLHSKTAGHPEFGLAKGIETTTGPLGQGLANSVGMAIAERTLAAEFNEANHPIIDHYTYVFLGDGCMMEGISHEACSLAGHLGLGKLIAFWDDNGISIDGKVAGWFSDDTPKRFQAYGWHVIAEVDGHDSESVKQAILAAREQTQKPTLICCKTTIGFGAPRLAGSSKAHGAALGDEEVKATREKLNWHYAPFEIPEEIYAAWDAREKGTAVERQWDNLWQSYQQNFPDKALELQRRLSGKLPEVWALESKEYITKTQLEGENTATRKASQNCLNQYGPLLPELFGGSADLTGSNLTKWMGSETITNEVHTGNYLFYGVREFAMAAIMNGIALHGGFIPYGGTFLVFSDYSRNAIRLAALMRQRVIHVLTHDSIGLGEDGPTHQPVEQASSLRLIPNLNVWRACDDVETAVAWQQAIEFNGPTCLLLSRQSIPHQIRDEAMLGNINRGGYILKDCEGCPEIIILATGSEVQLAIGAEVILTAKGKKVRVVSMPCCKVFDSQDKAYQESVLPKKVKHRVAIEAGSSAYWYKYVGLEGQVFGLDQFGESAPAKDVFEHFGFTIENIVNFIVAEFFISGV